MKLHYHMICALAVLVVAFLPQSASAKCVSRVVAVNNGKSSATILAVAPDSGSPDLAAAGFADTTCGNLDKAAYRAAVCDPGTIGNRGVQKQLELQAGITFAQRCTAARADAGLPALSASPVTDGFSPSNRRPQGPPASLGMPAPLATANGATAPTGGN